MSKTPVSEFIPARTRLTPLKAALLYLIVAGAWIFLSDRLLQLVAQDPGQITRLQTAKGWLFVLVSATLLFFLVRHYIRAVRSREERLREVLMGLSVTSGTVFFSTLVEHLARTFGADAALLCEAVGPGGDRLRLISGWRRGQVLQPFECRLSDGPCSRILREKRPVFQARGLPRDFCCLGLEGDWRPESFLGAPLINASGKPLGVLAMMHGRPLRDPELAEELLPFLALQAAAELERRRAEEALRASEERFRSVFEIAAAGMVIMAPDGRILQVNPAFRRFLGYSEEELLSMNIADVTHPEDRQRTLELYRGLADGEGRSIHYEKRYLTRGGRTVWGHASVACLLGGEAGSAYCIGLVQDITDRKAAEEALRESNRELDAFVYTVSHDLRSPLTPIIGFAEFLREQCRERFDAETEGMLAEIQGQGEKMLALLEDLLCLAKVGQLECPLEPVEAAEVVRETLADLASRIHAAGAAVRTGPLPPIGVPKTLLTQVFGNLVGNAVHYAGAAGGPIEIGGERRGDRVRFFVRDHGPGVPPAERERIFGVFIRGSTGKGVRGTGIGLAIVQKIARLYHGRAWVEDTPGGGATFWVEMIDECTSVREEGGG